MFTWEPICLYHTDKLFHHHRGNRELPFCISREHFKRNNLVGDWCLIWANIVLVSLCKVLGYNIAEISCPHDPTGCGYRTLLSVSSNSTTDWLCHRDYNHSDERLRGCSETSYKFYITRGVGDDRGEQK